MTSKFSAQPFSSQLRLLCKVLDDKDYEKIADYLLIFPMVNDPAVKFTEIYKNSHTIKTSNLLDHVIEFIHEKARPSVFLSYLRILSFVGMLVSLYSNFCLVSLQCFGKDSYSCL